MWNMEIKISDELNAIINYARQEAMRTGNYGIAPDHLFLGILRHEENIACHVLASLDTDLEEFKQFIDSRIFTNESIPYSEADHITFSRGAQNVLSITVLEASRAGSRIASSQHLLLALCRSTGGYGITYLRDIGIDYRRIADFLEKNGMLVSDNDEENPDRQGNGMDNIQETAQDGNERNAKQSALDDFGYDLTRAAEEGKLDPVSGREEETERVIQILGRRKKNNPMLVGDPGVGKSAIVEGIALRIASGDVPSVLMGKRIISLDIASVVAGTRYRGDFEKRLKSIIGELTGNPDIILFIDEFHTLVGAGGAAGSLDAANMLKPALARGELQCIGATTLDEFTRIVERDGALDRRFQKIVVEPTDFRQTLSILGKIRDRYEDYHSIRYTDAALEACVRLSDRYISDRCLPDKAIDAMDEAGSMVHLRNSRKKGKAEVGENDIACAISAMTGIPVGKVVESESERLVRMEERLKNRIVGQDDAINSVVRAIRRNRAGIKDPGKPIGSFLFYGPTGVGKTRLAKSIAEYLFGSQDNMIRIDMSEYMEKFTVSRLNGAPPGYVGYEDGGQLSERVRRQPYSVVLLDEIEKAHPDIFNILLQVLDEGRLTDSRGRTVDFRNTILIMTSNVGSREMDEYGNGVGYVTASRDMASNRKSILEKSIRKVFPPEFINRIDEQIQFRALGKDDMEKIIDIELRDLRHRVAEAGYRLNISPAAKRLTALHGYDPKYGARPLKRAIQRYIEDPVSEYIISGKAAPGNGQEQETIKVGLTPDKSDTVVTAGRQSHSLHIDEFEVKITDDTDKGAE